MGKVSKKNPAKFQDKLMTQWEAVFLPESAPAWPHLKEGIATAWLPVDTWSCTVSDERTLSADSLAPGGSWPYIWKRPLLQAPVLFIRSNLFKDILHFFKVSVHGVECGLFCPHCSRLYVVTCWDFSSAINIQTDMNFYWGTIESHWGKREIKALHTSVPDKTDAHIARMYCSGSA
jgi:hypothetical protein